MNTLRKVSRSSRPTASKRVSFKQRVLGAAAIMFAVLAIATAAAWIVALRAQQKAQRNFDVASELVTGIARGLRHVEGMDAESRKKIFDEASTTLDRAVAVSPDDPQLLGLQATIFDEFASTHQAEGEQASAAESTVKSLEMRLRLNESAPSLPEFPWPPPTASSSYVLPDDLLVSYETVGEVVDAIISALERNGYVERSYFQTKPGGVALVTRLERINEDGSPASQQERWSAGKQDYASKDLVGFLRGLFFVDPGHYRVIAFILQDPSFVQSDHVISADEARKWLTSGGNVLPPEIARLPFGDGHCTVLVYEFASDGSKVALVESKLTGKQHLEKSGLLTVLQRAYQEMLANDRALAAANPEVPERQRDVSIRLEKIAKLSLDAGDSAGALTLYEKSMAIRRKLFETNVDNDQYKRGLSDVIERIGDVRRELGNFAGALAAYLEMLGYDRERADANMGDTKLQRVVSLDLNKIADVKLATNDTEGALAAAEESLNIVRRIVLTAPENIEWRRDISISLERLGNIKSNVGDKQAALKAYEEMLAIDRSLAILEPGNLQRWREVMFSLNKVGDVRYDLNDASGALTDYDEGLRIARMLMQKEADNPQAPRDLAVSLDKVGDANLKVGGAQSAIIAYEEGLVLRRQIAESYYDYRRDVSLTLDRITAAKLKLNDIPGSRATAEESVAIARDLANLRKGNVEAQIDLVVGLYKFAETVQDERKDAVIDEGLQLLALLDEGGKLSAEQKGLKDLFLALRNGAP